jgi:hypothetical protein
MKEETRKKRGGKKEIKRNEGINKINRRELNKE